jgi:hypothetical protein
MSASDHPLLPMRDEVDAGDTVLATLGENRLKGVVQSKWKRRRNDVTSGYYTAYRLLLGEASIELNSPAWVVEKIEPPYKDPEFYAGMIVRASPSKYCYVVVLDPQEEDPPVFISLSTGAPYFRRSLSEKLEVVRATPQGLVAE